MMPNKKNPDPAELVRGRAARVIGALTGVAHPAQGPAARLPARPPGGQAAAVRGRRDAGGVARRHGRAARDARHRPRPDAGGRRRGLHDRDGRRRRAGPARRAVPGRAPRRRLARRPGRGGRHRPRRRAGRDDRPALGAAGDADDRGRSPRTRRSATRSAAAASVDGALAPCDVIGGTAPSGWRRRSDAARARLDCGADERPPRPDRRLVRASRRASVPDAGPAVRVAIRAVRAGRAGPGRASAATRRVRQDRARQVRAAEVGPGASRRVTRGPPRPAARSVRVRARAGRPDGDPRRSKSAGRGVAVAPRSRSTGSRSGERGEPASAAGQVGRRQVRAARSVASSKDTSGGSEAWRSAAVEVRDRTAARRAGRLGR